MEVCSMPVDQRLRSLDPFLFFFLKRLSYLFHKFLLSYSYAYADSLRTFVVRHLE